MANNAGGKPGLVSITKKILMAFTGLALCVFLVLHLIGNMLLLFGDTAFNRYAHLLMTWPPGVLAFELGLLALFLIHAYEGVVVYRGNKKARPEGYAVSTWAKTKSERSRKSVSSTTMLATGAIILIFMLLHVGHLKFNKFGTIKEYETPVAGVQKTDVSKVTLGVTGAAATATENPEESAKMMRDLATLVREEFKNPIVVILYVLCMIALGLHLNHAIYSASQTIGVNNRKWEKPIWTFGKIFTIVIAGGFIILPLYFFLVAPAPQAPYEAHSASHSTPTAEPAPSTP